MTSNLTNLERLLRERLAVIADHAMRDRDSAAHLEKLRAVSEALEAEHRALHGRLPARLAHFMQGCSYQKALAFIEHARGGAPFTGDV